MIEIKINENANDKIIRESLTRMGIQNRKEKILYPSCYLYEADGKFFIAHFKELFLLREKGYDDLTDEDIDRRNAIVSLLYDWGLIDLDGDFEQLNVVDKYVFVLSYKEKKNWTIKHKIKFWSKKDV